MPACWSSTVAVASFIPTHPGSSEAMPTMHECRYMLIDCTSSTRIIASTAQIARLSPLVGMQARADLLPQLPRYQHGQQAHHGDPIAEALLQKSVQQGRSRIAQLLMELLHPGELAQLAGGGGERETLKPDPGLSATGVLDVVGSE